MSSIHQRIRELIAKKGHNKHSFSKHIGTTSQVLQDIVNGRLNKPSYTTFEKIIAAFPDVNANWLITGKGNMFYNNQHAIQPEKNFSKDMQQLVDFKYQRTKIPLYNIIATAGNHMEFFENPENITGYLELSKEFHDCSVAVPLYGDSMYPLLNSGDIILLKNVSSVEYIKWGHIYLIITDSDKMLKFLHTTPNKGNVLLKSYNEKFYEPFELPRKKIIKLYEVKGYIRKMEM